MREESVFNSTNSFSNLSKHVRIHANITMGTFCVPPNATYNEDGDQDGAQGGNIYLALHSQHKNDVLNCIQMDTTCSALVLLIGHGTHSKSFDLQTNLKRQVSQSRE